MIKIDVENDPAPPEKRVTVRLRRSMTNAGSATLVMKNDKGGARYPIEIDGDHEVITIYQDALEAFGFKVKVV